METYSTWTAPGDNGGFSVTLTIRPMLGMRTMLLRELGLGSDTSREEARRAYRVRAKELHPDAGGDREAFEKLQRIWETLEQVGWGNGEQ